MQQICIIFQTLSALFEKQLRDPPLSASALPLDQSNCIPKVTGHPNLTHGKIPIKQGVVPGGHVLLGSHLG